MKFFCEYCGNRIDAEKDHKCPHCGASYKQNEKFIKLEEERKREQQVNNEYKHKIINHVLGTVKFSRFFMIIPILIFVIVLTIIITGIIRIDKKSNDNRDNNTNVEEMFDSVLEEQDKMEDIFDSIIEEQTKEQEKVTVNFNEFAETKDYKVKVEKYEAVEDTFNRLDAGYEYVKFHLIVENLTTHELTKEDVNCIVDGIAQTNKLSSGYSDLPMFIASELAVKGTATFIVPKDTTSYDIRYGDYVTIHIEK